MRFQVPEGGALFEGFRWRTVKELNVNYVWLYIYTEEPASHRLKVWYDHVVVATDYIGPIQPAKWAVRNLPGHPLFQCGAGPPGFPMQ